MSNSSVPRLAYTVEEAAELLSISRAQLYRLIDLGEIQSITIGRSRRLTRSQLEAYVRSREAQCQIPGAALLAELVRGSKDRRSLAKGAIK